MYNYEISVVIPTYNSLLYLKEAINSVINQSYENWEILIIDNHSDDGTDKYVENLNNIRIKYYKIQNYGIIAKSRNLGIRLSKGKYIAFLDSDDSWHKDKLLICMNVFKKNNCDFISHNFSLNKNFKKNKKIKIKKISSFKKFYSSFNPIFCSGVVLKKSILDDVSFSEKNKYNGTEDYLLWLTLLLNEKTFILIKNILGFYRVHNSNFSRNIRKQLSSEINTLRFFKINQFISYRFFNKRVSLTYFGYANKYKKNMDLKKSKFLLKKSLKKYNFNIRSLILYFLIILKS